MSEIDRTESKQNTKNPLTPEQRRARKRRKAEYQTVFINGKQKRVRREPVVEGLPVDEFLRRHADPVLLHRLGRWERIEQPEQKESSDPPFGSNR